MPQRCARAQKRAAQMGPRASKAQNIGESGKEVLGATICSNPCNISSGPVCVRVCVQVTGEGQYYRGRPVWVQGPRGRLRRHHNIQSGLQSQGPVSFPAWRLLGSQLGASPEPEPLGCGSLSHLRPCTSVPRLTLQLRTCPFGRGGGGCK